MAGNSGAWPWRCSLFAAPLLLLDEPTAGLDWSVRQQVIELLARLKSTWTVLVVSHDPEELSSIADVRWLLQAGSLQPLPAEALLYR